MSDILKEWAYDRATGVFLRDEYGNMTLRTGASALKQRLEVRLGMHQGEFPFDLRRGVPYLTQLVDVSDELTRTVLRDEIAACPGVQRVNEITVTSDRASRRRSVEFTVNGEVGVSL